MTRVFRDLLNRDVYDPALVAELRATDDASLLARGMTPPEVSLLRSTLTPLQNFSWVLPGQLAGCARPRWEESIAVLADAGVRTLISLTEDPLPDAWLEHAGISGVHIPIGDFHAPTQDQLAQAAEVVDASLQADKPVAVHCAAGRGRTGTVLAAYLVHRGASIDEALIEVRRLRPDSVESADQMDALHAYAAAGAPP